MKFTLPMPIGINHLYKSGKNGWYKEHKAVLWQNEALWKIKSERKIKMIRKPCIFKVNWFRKDKRRWDIDSGLKLLLDTFVKAGVLEDDSLIDELMVLKIHNPKIQNNYCMVEVI